MKIKRADFEHFLKFKEKEKDDIYKKIEKEIKEIRYFLTNKYEMKKTQFIVDKKHEVEHKNYTYRNFIVEIIQE